MSIEESYDEEFYLQFGKFLRDIDIAEKLGLSLEEYENVLYKNGAYKDGGLMFHFKKDAQKAMEELMPYIIIAKLTN